MQASHFPEYEPPQVPLSCVHPVSISEQCDTCMKKYLCPITCDEYNLTIDFLTLLNEKHYYQLTLSMAFVEVPLSTIHTGTSRVLQEPFKSPSRALQEPFKSPSRALQEPFKSPSRALQEPFKSPSRALQEPFKSPPRALQERAATYFARHYGTILIQRPDDKDIIPMCDLDNMPVKKITISVTYKKTLNVTYNTLNNVYECNQNTFQWKKGNGKVKLRCDFQIGAAHNGNKMLNYFGSIYGYTNNGNILNLPGIIIELKSKLDVGENNLFQAKSIFMKTEQSYMVINGNINQHDITILRFRGMILGNSGKLFSLSLTNYVELNSHFLTKSNSKNICFYSNLNNETDAEASCTEIPSRIVDIEIKLRNDSIEAIINHSQAVVTFKVECFAEQTSNGGTLIIGASKNETAVWTYLKDVIAFDKELYIARDVDSISGIIESSFPGITPCFRSIEIPNAYMTRNVTIEFKCWECEGQKCTFPDTSKLLSQSNYFNNDITFVTKFTNDMQNIEYYRFEKPLHGVLHPISGEANKLFNMTTDLGNSHRSGVLKVVDIHKQSKLLAIQMITTISRVNFEVFLPHGKNLSFVELDHIVIDVNVIGVKYDIIIEDDLRTNLKFYIKKIIGNISQDKEFTFGDILDKNIVFTPLVSYKRKSYREDSVSSKMGKLHLKYKYHSKTSYLFLDFFPVKRKLKVEKVDYIRTNFTNPVKITPNLFKVIEINPFGIEVDSNLFLEKTPEIGKLSLGKHVLNKYDEVKSSQLKDLKYTQITYGSDDSISFAVKCDAANKTRFSCSESIEIMFKMPTTLLATNEINLYNRKTYTLSNRDISMNQMISNHELIIVVKKHPRCGILYRSSINVTEKLIERYYEKGWFTFEELVLGRIIYKLNCIHISKNCLLRDDFTVGIDKVLDQDVIVRVNAYSSFTHKDPQLRIKDTLYLSPDMLIYSMGHKKAFILKNENILILIQRPDDKDTILMCDLDNMPVKKITISVTREKTLNVTLNNVYECNQNTFHWKKSNGKVKLRCDFQIGAAHNGNKMLNYFGSIYGYTNNGNILNLPGIEIELKSKLDVGENNLFQAKSIFLQTEQSYMVINGNIYQPDITILRFRGMILGSSGKLFSINLTNYVELNSHFLTKSNSKNICFYSNLDNETDAEASCTEIPSRIVDIEIKLRNDSIEAIINHSQAVVTFKVECFAEQTPNGGTLIIGASKNETAVRTYLKDVVAFDKELYIARDVDSISGIIESTFPGITPCFRSTEIPNAYMTRNVTIEFKCWECKGQKCTFPDTSKLLSQSNYFNNDITFVTKFTNDMDNIDYYRFEKPLHGVLHPISGEANKLFNMTTDLSNSYRSGVLKVVDIHEQSKLLAIQMITTISRVNFEVFLPHGNNFSFVELDHIVIDVNVIGVKYDTIIEDDLRTNLKFNIKYIVGNINQDKEFTFGDILDKNIVFTPLVSYKKKSYWEDSVSSKKGKLYLKYKYHNETSRLYLDFFPVKRKLKVEKVDYIRTNFTNPVKITPDLFKVIEINPFGIEVDSNLFLEKTPEIGKLSFGNHVLNKYDEIKSSQLKDLKYTQITYGSDDSISFAVKCDAANKTRFSCSESIDIMFKMPTTSLATNEINLYNRKTYTLSNRDISMNQMISNHELIIVVKKHPRCGILYRSSINFTKPLTKWRYEEGWFTFEELVLGRIIYKLNCVHFSKKYLLRDHFTVGINNVLDQDVIVRVNAYSSFTHKDPPLRIKDTLYLSRDMLKFYVGKKKALILNEENFIVYLKDNRKSYRIFFRIKKKPVIDEFRMYDLQAKKKDNIVKKGKYRLLSFKILMKSENSILIQRPDDKDPIPMCDLDKMPVKKITISVTSEKTLNVTLNNVYECNQNTFQWNKRNGKVKLRCDFQIGAAHNGNKMLDYFGSIYGYTNNGDILNTTGIKIELKSKLYVGENNLFQAKSIFLHTEQSYMVIKGYIYKPDITVLRFRGMILGNSGKLFSLSLTNYVELNSHFLTKSNSKNICFYSNLDNEIDAEASCTEIPSRIVDIEIKLRNDSMDAIINHSQEVVTFKVKRFAEQTSNGGTLIFGASKNETAVWTYLKDVVAFDKELYIARDVHSISGIIESSFPGITPCFRSTEIPNAYMTRNVTIEFKCWECEGQKCTFPDTSKLFSQSNYFNNDITFLTKFINNDMQNIDYYLFVKPLHGVLHPISGESNKLFNMTSDLSNSYRSGVLNVVDIHEQSKLLAIQMITTISRVNFEVFLPHGKNLSFVELDHIVIDVNVIDVKYDPIIEDDLRTNLKFNIKYIVGNINQDKEFTFGDILDKNIVFTPLVSYEKKDYVDTVSSKKGVLHLKYKYHNETSRLYLDFFPVKRIIKVEKVDYIWTNFTNPVKITPDLLKVTEINPFGIEVDSNLFLEKLSQDRKIVFRDDFTVGIDKVLDQDVIVSVNAYSSFTHKDPPLRIKDTLYLSRDMLEFSMGHKKILIQRPDDKDTIPMCDLDKKPVKKITISVTREKTLNVMINNVYECNQNTFQWKKGNDKVKLRCDFQIGAAHNGNKMLNYFGSIYGYTDNGNILNLPGIKIELKSKLDVGENNLFQAKSIFLQTEQSYMVINGNIYQPDITILKFRGMIFGNSGKLFSLSLTNYVELNSHFLTKNNSENICFYCNLNNETDAEASCTEVPSRIVDIEIKLRNDSVDAIINHNQAVVTFKVKRFAEQTSIGGTVIFGASKNETAVQTYLKDVVAFDKELYIARDVYSISGIMESSFPGISPCFRSTEILNAYMTRNVTIEFKCWECEGQKCTFPDTTKLLSQSNYFNNDITFVTKFTNNDMHNIQYYSFEKPLHGVLHPISGESNKLFNMTSDLSNSYRSGVLKVVDIHKQSKLLAIQMITTISRVNYKIFVPHGLNLSFVELDHIVIDVNVINVKYDTIIEDDLRTNLKFYVKKIYGNITQDKEFTFGDILDKNIVFTPLVSYKKSSYGDSVSSKKGILLLKYKYHSETSYIYLDFFPVKRNLKVEKVDYIRTNFTNPVKITPDLLNITEINPFGIEVDSNLFLKKTPEIGKLSLGNHVLNKYDEVKSSQLKDLKYTQITYGSNDSISFAVKCDAANKTRFSCSESIKIIFKMPTTSLASNEINLYNRKTYTLSNRDIIMNPMISNHELIIVVKKLPRCGTLYRSSINVTKQFRKWGGEKDWFTFEELVLGRIIYKLNCIHFSKKYLIRDDFTVGIDKVLDQDVIVRVNAYSSFTHTDPPVKIKDTLYLSRAMLKFSIGHRKAFFLKPENFIVFLKDNRNLYRIYFRIKKKPVIDEFRMYERYAYYPDRITDQIFFRSSKIISQTTEWSFSSTNRILYVINNFVNTEGVFNSFTLEVILLNLNSGRVDYVLSDDIDVYYNM
ncbi:hypothetical protein GQR58_008467 [Nymphon striatum]|nr:hypothetical protein GQR58_008467 [Nymphon striatum]